jgi:hypothetical protein
MTELRSDTAAKAAGTPSSHSAPSTPLNAGVDAGTASCSAVSRELYENAGALKSRPRACKAGAFTRPHPTPLDNSTSTHLSRPQRKGIDRSARTTLARDVAANAN